ncbi:23S rRNA pseudouridine1911/1915/1917 synthase [Paenibacillus shirakamiensis]|uniref:Pseudouridine synthase n=1 Tax=Paenibacillus shirakamiensis TaxID=1265935 RepID=A0ABS4JFM6_9BACL|nr:RluA family pseudouridine synthase [Paenibacillus shirakamiensis]MBP2000508.1 23S rRNA pseudouridine1911/1915/1917 synthase [Paenibacillus shirakamiensis]
MKKKDSAKKHTTRPKPKAGAKPKSNYTSKPTRISAAVKPRICTVKETTELLPFLLETFSNLGRNAVKAILARGQVTVNSEPTTAYNYQLEPGYIVTIYKQKAKAAPALIGMKIMFEDDDIIVIQKEHGLLSVATGQENEITAYRQLMAHVRAEDEKARIFIVHRLDRDTSGVMLFAKKESIQQKLQNAWQDMVKERSYVALVDGEVKKQEGTVRSWLKESATLKMYSSPHPNDGLLAITHYRKLQGDKFFTLLEVNLETGRKNQIRVHMEEIGHPVAGDKKYGSKSKLLGRLGLHARVLAFEHPTTGIVMRFDTDIPKIFMKPFRITPTR